jgi:hypothetical protein
MYCVHIWLYKQMILWCKQMEHKDEGTNVKARTSQYGCELMDCQAANKLNTQVLA